MKLKVIYIDDEPDLCDIFTDHFSTEEIEIKTYTDPKAAIERVIVDSPDLVFIDFRLPRTSGDKVAHAMKVNCPVYLISGELNIKTDFKFNGILTKPMSPAEVKAIIDSEYRRIKN